MKFSNWINRALLISMIVPATMMSCSSDNDVLESGNEEVLAPIAETEATTDTTTTDSTDYIVEAAPASPIGNLADDEVVVNGEAVKVDFWIEPEMVYLKAADHQELNKPGLVMAFRPSETPRGRLVMDGWKGTEGEPITIVNKEQVTVASSEAGKHALWFTGCENIRVMGNGNPKFKYGIHVVESGSSGMSFDQKTTGVEVAYIEIQNTDFAGILAKTDNAHGWVMRNLHIHHNLIHDTHGEGMYIGQTSVDKAHAIENLRVHHNLIHDTGWDLFQVANVQGNVEVYNNTMINGGKEQEPMQDQGFQIGDWSAGKYYNNVISNSNSRFLFIKGGHDIEMYNNYFSSSQKADAAFLKTEKKYQNGALLNIHDNWFRDYNNELFWSLITVNQVRIADNKYAPNNENSEFIVYGNGASEANHEISGNEKTQLPAIELDGEYNIKSGSYYDGFGLGYQANDTQN
ncbi:NosD domain-containing protein [Limibacter armeniacum]|uniref:NosD domain-containing protein n=1 Tax=Limibacter armeniacum TaxID=466084 RepID=UPI002FE60B32